MKRATGLLTLLLALAAAPAAAQQQEAPSALAMTVENRTAAAEAERGTPRDDERIAPGDVLRYRLAFTNHTGRPVRGVVLSNPVPGELRFRAGSAQASRPDAAVEYSADGGKSFSPRPVEEVVVDGKRVRRPVSPERYTHVRWTVGGAVAPGATVTAEFDARFPAAPGR